MPESGNEDVKYTDDVREMVWSSVLDADMNTRYYAHECPSYHRWDKWSKVFIALSSSSAMASWNIWADPQKWTSHLWQGLSMISVTLAVTLNALDISKRIQKMTQLHTMYIDLWREYESLWIRAETGQIGAVQIIQEHIRLQEKFAEIKKLESDVKAKKKLLEQCQQEVVESRGL